MSDTDVLTRPVVVYGANGFIGRNLLLELSGLGMETIAVSRSFDASFADRLSDAIRWVKFDFTDTDGLFEKVVPKDGVTHVLLVSDSLPSTWTKIPSREVSGTLLPYVRFLERLHPDDRVIFLSSGGTVYGVSVERRPLRENDAIAVPISAYGVTKLTIEKYLAFIARTAGFDHVTLRPSNPVGPWTKRNAAQGFVAVLLENHLAGKTTHIWGGGSATRDYLDVRDLADAIITVCGREDIGGETFNVGSGIGRSLSEVVALVQETLDIDLAVEIDDERGVDVPYNVLDCSHIERSIGWRASRDFKTTICDTWAFQLSRSRESAGIVDTNAVKGG